ncbi:hypothetical protein PoB_004436600 [Plakobranchus ocellatus]|uniref:LolA-like domain-containing protein n=1 Tax=Plakobranchus ocellatus TaxID=259542 RepID=A0AAV4B3C9_9GAST|nr:hypothetical protein PoB_004436600 [Plakobranchus ocellatus]
MAEKPWSRNMAELGRGYEEGGLNSHPYRQGRKEGINIWETNTSKMMIKEVYYQKIRKNTLMLAAVLSVLFKPARSDLPFDKTVCSPPKISALSPLPALGDVYSASIRWTSQLDKSIYDVRDDYDRRRGQAALTINMPRLPAAAKMIYDLKLGSISVIDDVTQRDCTVQQPDASFHTYNELPFLAGLTGLTNNMESARDLQYLGETTLNDVDTDHYSACLYDYVTNTTMLFDIYYIGRLGTASLTWQLPHVPKMDRSLPYIIKLHAKRGQHGKLQEFKVTGTVGKFDVNPAFEDTTFLPPPGTWCEGLPLTTTPDLPASFSLLAEMVHLDASKVSYQQIFFNAKRKLVRRDWKEISVDSTTVDSGPPYTSIYDFNNGVKYNIDRHLQSCDRVSPITENNEFAEPVPQKRISPHEFRLAKSDLFFRTRNARVQVVGQRTLRGVTTDVYIGQYPDPNTHRNFTIQWFFSKAHWQVYSGALIESGALMRMEVYEEGIEENWEGEEEDDDDEEEEEEEEQEETEEGSEQEVAEE